MGRPAPVSLSKDQQSVASKTSINFPNLMHDEVYTYQYDAGRKWKAYEIWFLHIFSHQSWDLAVLLLNNKTNEWEKTGWKEEV